MAVNTRTLPVRMERELYDRVKEISEQEKRSLSNWCVLAIEKEVKRYETENKKK